MQQLFGVILPATDQKYSKQSRLGDQEEDTLVMSYAAVGSVSVPTRQSSVNFP